MGLYRASAQESVHYYCVGFGVRDTTPIMENKQKQEWEVEMETGLYRGLYGLQAEWRIAWKKTGKSNESYHVIGDI